jgi:hypothetical protein
MPVSYLIDVPNRVVFSRAWGMLSDQEIIAHAQTLKNDPRLEPGYRQVGDFLATNALLLTSAAIRAVAFDNPFPRDARRAFVVPSDEAYGLARMFTLYLDADPNEFVIFRALEPALEWVGLPRSALWPDKDPDKTF